MSDEQQQLDFPGNSRPEVEDGVAEPPPRGKYVVFVDESGDHGTGNIDPSYPLFVLAFCVFHKRHYTSCVVPSVHDFKFKHFGHDCVVLHEHEIRKEKGAFAGLFAGKADKDAFMSELGQIVEASNFVLISCVVWKDRLTRGTRNIYHLALEHCLDGLHDFLIEKDQLDATTHVVFERRGKNEDRQLELEFRRICGGSRRKAPLPFEIVLADKKTNSAGLQLADLVARPIGLSVLRPGQPNRTYTILERKFYCEGGREQLGVGIDGYGLKVLP